MSIHILTHSIVLFLLVGCMLWSYLGALIAIKFAIPARIGAAIGAIGWPLGAGLLLVVGYRKRHEAALRSKPPGVGPTSALLPVAGGLLICATAFVSWGRWRVAWAGTNRLSGAATPMDSPEVATVIILSGLLVIGAGTMWRIQTRARWLVLPSLIVAWWTMTTAEALIIRSAVESVSGAASRLDHNKIGASISGGLGPWIMILGCGVLVAWAVDGAIRLARTRLPVIDGHTCASPMAAEFRPSKPSALTTPFGTQHEHVPQSEFVTDSIPEELAAPVPPTSSDMSDPWGSSTDAWQ